VGGTLVFVGTGVFVGVSVGNGVFVGVAVGVKVAVGVGVSVGSGWKGVAVAGVSVMTISGTTVFVGPTFWAAVII
jgi:hypothetical protein